jgi:hypothetical protein
MSTRPGWYPDPKHAKQDRWWDGDEWTAQVRAVPHAVRPWGKIAMTAVTTIVLVAASLAVLFVVLAGIALRGFGSNK